MNDEIIVRPLSINDDLEQVARLIYYTDDYIFPYLYNNDLDDGVEVIRKMIERNTLYNVSNVVIAIINEKIVGIVVAKRTPIEIFPEVMIDSFIDSNMIVDERFSKVYNDYYKLLADEPDGVYIANVCVDKNYRGMGVAKKMLTAILRDDEEYNLETVKDNPSAVNLYKSLGFDIQGEYLGFINVPCYRMHRPKASKGE